MFSIRKLFDPMGKNFRLLDPITGMAPDLKLILGITALLLAFIYVPALSGTIIRDALGVIMILLLPGYALMAALFPRNDDVGLLERTILSFTFSIAISSLLGFALNYLPWGIRPGSVIPGLALIVVACTVIANSRRHALPGGERFTPDIAATWRRSVNYAGSLFKADSVANVLLALSILIALSALIYAVIFPIQGEKFTEFYILGPDGRATNYTSGIIMGNVSPVIVGVNNHEQRDVTYDLLVSLNDSTNNSTLYSEQFKVPSNQSWQKMIDVKPDRNGTNMKMQFLLFADGNHTAPYRELHLWVNVTRPETVLP